MRQPLTPPQPDGSTHYADLLGRWLLAEALRHLNALHRAGTPHPDAGVLTEHLVERARLAGLFIYDNQSGVPRRAGTTWTRVHDRIAPRAAEAALQRWRADYFENQAAKGRKSGEVRRRRHYAKFLPFQLGEMDALPAKEVAARLGCSQATVYRLRKSRKEWLAMQVKPDYSDLHELLDDEPGEKDCEAQRAHLAAIEESAVLESLLQIVDEVPEPTSNLRLTDVMTERQYADILDDVLRER